MFKEFGYGSLIIVAAVGLGGNSSSVKDIVKPKGKVSGLNAHETHASASLLGQFRTSTTGWLWVRTDLYLHNGVQMRPLSEQELNRGQKGVGSADNSDKGLHDDDKQVTVIPSADQDFRGVFGDVHRATKSYKDMKNHSHNNPKQSLPLFRLMTTLDPNFIPAWTTGAAVLAMGHDRNSYQKAVEYLDEGLIHNPDNLSILNQKGFTLLARLRERNKAQAIFERGIFASKLVAQINLDEDEKDSLNNIYRWLTLVYRDKGLLAEMYQLADQGLALFPDDYTLNNIRNQPPVPLLPKAQNQHLENDVTTLEELTEKSETESEFDPHH